jgi:hypothetical protein
MNNTASVTNTSDDNKTSKLSVTEAAEAEAEAKAKEAAIAAAEEAEEERAKQMGEEKYRAWKRAKKKKKEKVLAMARQKELKDVEEKREKERQIREIAWKKKKAAEAARIAYIDSLTKRYVNNGGLYFGKLSNNQDKVWGVPEGDGEWTRSTGDTMYDGKWKNGNMNGKGTYYFGGKNNDGDNWKGQFLEGELHGLGEYSYKFEVGKDDEIVKKDAIYYKSRRVCFCDELRHGQMIKLKTGCDPNIVWVNATILERHETKRQLWKLKYQHDHGDCVKWIDLSCRKFVILTRTPLCHRFEVDDRTDRVPRSAEVYAPDRWKQAQTNIYNARMGGKKASAGINMKK